MSQGLDRRGSERPDAVPRVASGRKIGVSWPRIFASLKGIGVVGGEGDSACEININI